MLRKNKTLLIVAGPTAVGKTDLCINLAKKFNTNIISADSRQFYTEINIGTAKPSPAQLTEVRHHFINSHSIHEAYDVGRFEADALALLEALFAQHELVIMTGGSGLYIDAVCKGFDAMPAVDKSIRAALNDRYEKQGLSALQQQLKELDPDYYQAVDLNNPQRLIRALEVCIGSGKPYSSFRQKQTSPRPFQTLKIALQRDREELYTRIDQRMDQMIAEGLFEEAATLYPYRHHNALQTVGYKEIFGYMEGEYDKAEAIRLLKRNSRRYAKRQMTWFRKDEDYHWFHPSQTEEIIAFISKTINA
ncbi:MAG TPA: tRNA (adenosine(37)-N6)-dimethylallyltransferase MiaA [Cyclobacteriaceae bacterium]|nr:tRNA (adenosine(37)-N6)-dimethylallyltransferase MiaA [Cyclobacteriaceae bacterium]